MEYKGKDYLRRKLEDKRTRVKLRYSYYEMKDHNTQKDVTIPPYLREKYRSTLGWCSKAVDSLADRLVFNGFREDIFGFEEIYNLNNPDVLTDSAILGALISSCSFIYITKGEDGFPRMQVIDGGNATGIIDPITGLMYEGYAVLERATDSDIALKEAYFTKDGTFVYEYGELVNVEAHTNSDGVNILGYCSLVPIINRPDAVRPFGHSVISRACMYLQQYAKRTMERSDITAEFYSFPQKYVLGTDPEAEGWESWKATISSFLKFDKDSDGDRPVVGQFNTQSMAPFAEQLRTAASAFAGETGLTLDDLGFTSANPSSADAIRAQHESLRIKARKAQHTFGTGFLNAAYIAACIRDQYPFARSEIYRVKPRWEPIFTPDAASMGVYGDAIYKINQSIPGYIDEEKIEDMLGI